MRTDRGQIAMADSNMLNLDLAATHRLTLINRIPLRALFTSTYRDQALIAKTYQRGLSRDLSHRGQPSQVAHVAPSNDPDTNAATVVNGPSTRPSVAPQAGLRV